MTHPNAAVTLIIIDVTVCSDPPAHSKLALPGYVLRVGDDGEWAVNVLQWRKLFLCWPCHELSEGSLEANYSHEVMD